MPTCAQTQSSKSRRCSTSAAARSPTCCAPAGYQASRSASPSESPTSTQPSSSPRWKETTPRDANVCAISLKGDAAVDGADQDGSVDRVDPVEHPRADRHRLHDVQHGDDIELRLVGESRGRLERGGRAVGLGDEHSSHAIGRGPVTLEGEASRRLPGLEALQPGLLVNACDTPKGRKDGRPSKAMTLDQAMTVLEHAKNDP